MYLENIYLYIQNPNMGMMWLWQMQRRVCLRVLSLESSHLWGCNYRSTGLWVFFSPVRHLCLVSVWSSACVRPPRALPPALGHCPQQQWHISRGLRYDCKHTQAEWKPANCRPEANEPTRWGILPGLFPSLRTLPPTGHPVCLSTVSSLFLNTDFPPEWKDAAIHGPWAIASSYSPART